MSVDSALLDMIIDVITELREIRSLLQGVANRGGFGGTGIKASYLGPSEDSWVYDRALNPEADRLLADRRIYDPNRQLDQLRAGPGDYQGRRVVLEGNGQGGNVGHEQAPLHSTTSEGAKP